MAKLVENRPEFYATGFVMSYSVDGTVPVRFLLAVNFLSWASARRPTEFPPPAPPQREPFSCYHQPMSHQELVRRAIVWLRSKRHDPVLSGIASCGEVPDAIGWTSGHSTVIECKASRSDFHVDKWKYLGYIDTKFKFVHHAKNPQSRARCEAENMEKIHFPRMGNYRYYLCAPDVITPAMVAADHPDHGLLYAEGKRTKIIVPAPLRKEYVASRSEVRYLRFALVHLRDNLGKRGVTCDLIQSTLYFGDHGITFRKL